jgi:predicted aspartyl protease
MEKQDMGQILVKAKIENIKDLLSAKDGLRKPEQVRSIEVDDALVDTGAKLLSLPRRFVQQLGLEHFDTRPARTSAGTVPCEIYRAVWLTIAGRQCTVDVAEVPDECPVLIGYVPLELLDFVVDPVNQCLIGNPQHGGQNVLDLF